MDKRQGETQAREFAITLTSVSFTNSGKSSTLTAKGYASPVLLDTGSTYTYLDPNIAQALGDQVGAQALDQYGVAVVPCQVRGVNASVIYGFSGATITVPLSELVVDAKDKSGNPAKYSDGTPLCYWGILSSGDVGTNVLVRFPFPRLIGELGLNYPRVIHFSVPPMSFMTSTTKK